MPQQFDFRRLDPLIHAPARMAIMSYLAVRDEVSFNELSARLELTDGNLESHLRKLEEAGYLRATKSFVERKPHTAYRMLAKGRSAFERYRDELEKITLSRERK